MSPRRNNDRGERGLDLTIWGISDPELLAIVEDLSSAGDGWAHSYDVRVQLGENPEQTRRRSGVGQRLGWMRRYGWLERSDDDGRWRVTPLGHAILDRPELSRAVERALDGMNPAQRVRLTRELAEQGGRSELRTALRRQWTRSLGR